MHGVNNDSVMPDVAESVSGEDLADDRIAQVKRKILLTAMPVGAAASLGALVNLRNIPGATQFDYVAHGMLSGILVVLTAILYFRPDREFPVLVACILSLAGCFALRVFLALFGPNSAMPLADVFPPVYGFVPLIFVLTFVVAPRRTALLLSLGFYLLTASFVIVYVARHPELLGQTPLMGVIAQQYVVAHGLYIALLYVIPMIQREYEGAVLAHESLQRDREREREYLDRERSQRERLDVALSAAGMGLLEYGVKGDVFMWDDGVYDLLGIDRNIVPKPSMDDLMDRVHPEDRKAVAALLRGERGDTSSRREIETRFRVLVPRRGTRVLAMRARVYTDTGRTMRMAGVCWDVTEEEAQRAELERSNSELREFAFVASHDLKEPLRGIRGFTELLQRRLEDALDDESRDYMDYINSGVTRANGLIEALLEYSRVGSNPLNLATVDCNQLLQDVQRSLYTQIREAGSVLTAASLPRVLADESQLSRLFQNLISNAIHYAKPNEPARILVKAHRAGDEWVFSVSDNGVGIAEEHQERIFKIFQRLDKSRKDGTGIGLAVCNKIVSRHGGRLWVESREGYGTTFSFTVPYTAPEVLDSYEPSD